MGSSASSLRGCFRGPRNDGYYPGGMGVQFSEPLDEGLGHSFCYVRPQPGGSSPLVTPDRSDEFPTLYNGGGKHAFLNVGGADEPTPNGSTPTVSFKDEKEELHNDKGKQAVTEKPRLSASEKPKILNDKMIKIGPETSFKAISGASVSANTATPRSIMSCEQFNSFSNVLYDRAAAFESTSSFAHIPLQPVPRGFSGPLSGPLDRADKGFMSGPLERERGFMSGPLERGSVSGPLDCSVDRSHFSAPLNSSYHPYGGYFRKRRRSLVQFMSSMSGPLKKAITKTASSLAKTHKSLVSPVRSYIFTRARSKDANFYSGEKGKWKEDVDPVDASVEFSSTELDIRGSHNLQWAQGKAGEDRVHVVISEEQGWIFVGIYDGFNGPDAPDFLMSNLYPAVSQELQGLLWEPREEEPTVPAKDGEDVREEQVQEWWKAEISSPGRDDTQDQGEVSVAGNHDSKSCNGHSIVGDGTGSSNGVDTKGGSSNGLDTKAGSSNGLETKAGCSNGVDTKVDDRNSQNGHDSKPSKLPLEEHASIEKDRLKGHSNDSTPPESSNGLIVDPQTSTAASSDPDLSHSSYPSVEETSTSSRQEQGHPDLVKPDEGDERVATEMAGKQAEDRVDEIEDERSSDAPTSSEASSASAEQENGSSKKKRPGGSRHRHGHDRRKEQLRKYFQWRYDWDKEQSGAMQKVKNAKVAQEPDSPGKAKAVEHASVLKALARALESTENAYLDMADKVLYENPELALMGSCVLVMIMKDEDMYILNVGDSRAILAQHPKVEPVGKGGWNDSGARDSLLRLELERIIEETPMELEALESHENGNAGASCPSESSLLGALQLTIDHSTNIEEEVARLRAEHPDDDAIENDRVKGKLKVTRAFGAGFLKQPKWNNALLEMFQINFIGTTPYITCSPALYHHRLGPQDEFLVLSSDGLYQYFSNEEVVSHVEWFMKKFPDGDPAQHLIEELLFRAAKKAGMDFHELLDIPQGDRRKYHDDVSVMVISLEGRIWRSSG